MTIWPWTHSSMDHYHHSDRDCPVSNLFIMLLYSTSLSSSFDSQCHCLVAGTEGFCPCGLWSSYSVLLFFFMVDKVALDLGSRFWHSLWHSFHHFSFHSLSHHFKPEYWGSLFLQNISSYLPNYVGSHPRRLWSFNIHCSGYLRFHTAIAMIRTSSDVILSCKNSTLCIVCPLPCYLQSNNLQLMR